MTYSEMHAGTLLVGELKKQAAELEAVKRERDEALAQLKRMEQRIASDAQWIKDLLAR